MPNEDEILAAQTIEGGWTKAQLAEWGVPWPPSKGWKERLIEENQTQGSNVPKRISREPLRLIADTPGRRPLGKSRRS